MRKIFASLLFFIVMPVMADNYFTQTIVDGCSSNILGVTDIVTIKPVFEPINYNCSVGQYLPVSVAGCSSCPTEATCAGGTYPFNETKNQGIVYNDFFAQDKPYGCDKSLLGVASNISIKPVFSPKNIICSAGYYLIANDITCTICPANSYCPGGTYTFNETTDQGITACPAEHPYAPVGMWLQSQCGRQMHIAGDDFHDILYLHQSPANPAQHQLKILYSLNNTEYSANAVLRNMNEIDFPKVSAGATKGLHVLIHETINGIEGDYEYLICDDSVPECRGGE